MCFSFFKRKKKEAPQKDEPVKQEKQVVESKKESKPAPAKPQTDPKPEVKVDKVKKASSTYHVSQNKDEKSEHHKKWRVRKAGSSKTIKYFETQKEAIDYAKQLSENNDSNITIHKLDGTIRKQDYSKDK